MGVDDRLGEPMKPAGRRMARRKLLKGLGGGVVTLLTAPVGVGMLDPLPASAASNIGACLEAIEQSNLEFARAGERVFQADLAVVEARYQARLMSFLETEWRCGGASGRLRPGAGGAPGARLREPGGLGGEPRSPPGGIAAKLRYRRRVGVRERLKWFPHGAQRAAPARSDQRRASRQALPPLCTHSSR